MQRGTCPPILSISLLSSGGRVEAVAVAAAEAAVVADMAWGRDDASLAGSRRAGNKLITKFPNKKCLSQP